VTSASTGASAQLARLLSLVPWLQARPGVTKTEAAAAFGISTDQLEKDLRLAFTCELPGQPDVFIDIDYLDANLSTLQTYAEHRIRVRAGDTWLPKVDCPEPLAEEVEEFAKCIEEGRPSLTDGLSGLKVVRTLERLSAAMKVESAA